MATITAITSSGTPLNVLSTSTWVGGVVPGATDTVVFPNQALRTTFTSPVQNGFLAQAPWTGQITLPVASTTGFPATGSIYIFPAPFLDPLLPVKLDYTGSTATSFLSCSVDYSFRNWIYQNSHSRVEAFPGDNVAMGDLRYGDYIYRGFTGSIAATNPFNWQNQYVLTGSATWTVEKINIGHGCDFTVKDTATLILNNTITTTTCFIQPVSSPAYGGMRLLDSCTFRVTGSYDNRSSGQINGIFLGTVSNAYLIVSGSSNYSSSLLTSSSAAGTATLTLQNASNFALGDFITVQSIPNSTRIAYVRSGSNSLNVSGSLSKFGTPTLDFSFPVGSHYGSQFATYDTASHETDEVVQIESINSNVVTVSQRFGKQGEIQQDLGLYDFRSFTETYLSSPEPYVGTMRAVLVDSNHENYKAGDTLIISGAAYRVHHATSYLSQSAFIDFTTPATKWTDHIALDEYMYSGSGYTMTGTFRPVQRKWTLLTTASRAGISSLYINSASCTTPANPALAEASIFACLKNTYFTEGEIVLSGSIMRDFTTADSSAGSTGLGVYCGFNPYQRTYVTSGTNTSAISGNSSIFEGASGLSVFDSLVHVRHLGFAWGNTMQWSQTGSIDPNQNPADLPITPFTGSGQSVSLKITRENGIQRYFLQNVLLDEALLPAVERGMIAIALQRFASVFSINIRERYQLLLLDTQQSFSPRDFIKQGGLLDNHVSGKVCKFIANEIEDPMGMRNLLWDYYYNKGKTNILPYCHNFIQTTAGNVDTGLANSGLMGRNMAWRTTGASGFTPNQINKTSTNFFITYDLGQAVNFDTVGVGIIKADSSYAENDTNNRLLGVRIDVADNPDSWTTVWAKADDNRLATNGNAVRFYTFPSGSVTKRFVRFYSDGGSASTGYNNQSFFGIYNFATGSAGLYPGNTTNQIKLRSAQNFDVGDQIWFWNKDADGKISDGGLNQGVGQRFINYDSITNITTTATDANVVGGLTDYYTITAKSGSVITLDRTPAYDHLLERTVVMKLNRGKINITGGRINRVTLQQAGALSTFYIEHVQHYNCNTAATVPGIIKTTDATYTSLRAVLEDVFLYSPQRNRFTHSVVGMRERNVIGRVTAFGPGLLDTYVSSYTGIVFNMFSYGSNSSVMYWPIGHVDRLIFNSNVMLLQGFYNSARTGIETNGAFERRGRIIIKNNHYQLVSAVDVRTLPPGQFPLQYVDQIYKLTEWKNNYFSGIFAASAQAAGVVGNSPLTQLWNMTDLRNNGFKPIEAKIPASTLANQGVPYLASARIDTDIRGYLETINIRLDKSNFIRMTSKSSTSMLIFDETGYYSAWQTVTPAVATPNEHGNFLNCSFYVNKPSSVKVQLSMLCRVTNGRKHNIAESPSAARSNQGFIHPNRVLPKILIVDADKHVVLSRTIVNNIAWQTINIDETFTLNPGHYAVVFETGYDITTGGAGGRTQRILDYTRPDLSIATTDLANLTVYHNNWDVHKLFDNAELNTSLDPFVSANRGVTAVERIVNNLATSVKFNKVKL